MVDLKEKVADIPIPVGYILDGNTIKKLNMSEKGPKEVVVCDVILISDVSRDSKSNQQSLSIIYWTGKSGYLCMTVPADQISSKNIDGLAQFGADITASNKYEVNTFLIKQRKLIEATIHYSSLGWFELDSKRVFAIDKVIVGDDNYPNARIIDEVGLSPNGHHYKLNDPSCPIFEDLKSNKNLQIALLMGLSSALIPVIRVVETDIGSQLYSIVGGSSSGKTTAAKLAISTAGASSNEENSLYGNWSTTMNAVTARLANNFGIPILIDEVSEARFNDMSTVIYNISDGKEKARLTKESEMKKSRHWCTAVISTGESSLLQRTNHNDGLSMRVLEFTNVEWTSSSEQSDKVKLFAEKNYGYWIRDMILGLYRSDIDSGNRIVQKYFKEMKSSAMSIVYPNQFQTRLAARVAVLGTTARVVNDILDFTIDADEIQSLVVQYCGLDVSSDIGERAFEDVLSELVRIQDELVSPTTNPLNGKTVINHSKDTKGFFKFDTGTLVIDVLYSTIKSILKDLEYEDSMVILKKWRDKGYIKSESDRLNKRGNIDGKRVRLIEIVVPDDQRQFFYRATENIGNRQYSDEVTTQPIVNKIDDVLKDFTSSSRDISEEFEDLGEEDDGRD